jgi:AmmeMemoRadiSam system protein A
MAFQAAFRDPRFTALTAGELKDVEVEISLLSAPRDVGSPSAIVVGRDGVILRKAGHSAVFLPQVAPQQGWTRDQMLDRLCVKAGLREGCWTDHATLSTFQAEVFGEPAVR